jgi:uncharacterized pyridoxamine 5'-phosphate oxidase family protein
MSLGHISIVQLVTYLVDVLVDPLQRLFTCRSQLAMCTAESSSTYFALVKQPNIEIASVSDLRSSEEP